jgi:small GTP-binding protein
MTTPKPRSLKVCLVGASGVGKSSIVGYYGTGVSEEAPVTIGVDYLSKDLLVGQEMVHLRIWDTAGQEKYKSVVPAYIRDCVIAFVVYDATDADSYTAAMEVFANVKSSRGLDAVIVLCANKCDIAADHSHVAAREFARQNGCLFFATSAKTGENIIEMFQAAADRALPLHKRLSDNDFVQAEVAGSRCYC